MKKRIKEGQFEVSMTKVVNGQPQIVSKTITALNQEDALRMAKQGMTDFNTYQNVQVRTTTSSEVKKKLNPNGKPNQPPIGTSPAPIGAPQSLMASKIVRPNVKKVVESIDPNGINYPFSIMLPQVYRGVFESMRGLVLTERYGRVYVEIGDASSMKGFLTELKKNKTPAALVVAEGIVAAKR